MALTRKGSGSKKSSSTPAHTVNKGGRSGSGAVPGAGRKPGGSKVSDGAKVMKGNQKIVHVKLRELADRVAVGEFGWDAEFKGHSLFPEVSRLLEMLKGSLAYKQPEPR